MALSAPRARSWAPGHLPQRLAALGLALAFALGTTYVVLQGNPFARTQSAPTYQTAAATLGVIQVAVSATGPITTAASIPLSFPSACRLSEIDVSIGQA